MLSPLYGQLSPLRVPTKAVRKVSDDADANTYLLAVESADGQELESGVIAAVETFIVGCKSDGIWSALKASCILAGARTLSGALVPLVGSAPTNNNFVNADYNRETGLKGDATTKYISHSAGSIVSNNLSYGIYLNSDRTTGGSYIGPASAHQIAGNTTGARIRPGVTTFTQMGTATAVPGSISANLRTTDFDWLCLGQSGTAAKSSSGTITTPFFIFAVNVNGSPVSRGAQRMTFYFAGNNLSISALDSRVSTLMTDLAAAIP